MRLFRRSGTAGRAARGIPADQADQADQAVPADRAAADTEAVAPVGAVNGYQVLETVTALPISTWRYLWEPEQVRHLGPMAQDWHAAFDFHHANTGVIPIVDANGVALVCIQALNRRIDELTAEVHRLRGLSDTPREQVSGE